MWYETGWVVQVNEDGSIPDRAPGGAKAFEPLKSWQETAARDHIRKIVEEDDTDVLRRAWIEREGEDIRKMG